MSDLTRKRFINLSGDVMDLAKIIIPDNVNHDLLFVNVSRELFVAYVLYAIDTLHCSEPIEHTLLHIEFSSGVQKSIRSVLNRSLEVKFFISEEVKKGYFYLSVDEKTGAMNYAVMKGSTCYNGEILDAEYAHFNYKLKRKKTLSLKEINFLIDKVIAKRKHLKKNAVVIDPLCYQYFSHFLTYDQIIQQCAIKLLLSHLKMFINFNIDECTAYNRGFYDVAPISLDEIEEKVLNFSQMRDHSGSEKLMTDEAISCRDAEFYQAKIQAEMK